MTDPYQPQQPYDPNAQQPPQQPYSDPYAAPQQPGSPAAPYGQPGSPAAPYSGQPYTGQPYTGQEYGGQQYYGQYPGQQQYPAGGYAQTPGTNVMAILSLVFAFVFAPVGIVLGHIAKKQIKERGEQGGGLATAGLVLSYIFTGLTAAFCCIGIIAAIASGGDSGSTY
ncbi:DUF4190 domain-containing protein [Phytohabitans rumicis]|uniref:DUF4190 domain-containing protein n=1 Tax=Phytohabitans rumicis TaxID=1076125 RepID=A0A6V8L826_9ACTN|nr:DUF4190 domain-containing protein [Phytohabitans rumicis]GFJ91138.1 hypothetical protein Prum_047800 [Phytohabitans rumicis]